MTTLAVMKARIVDELDRSDLTSQIAYAISDAILAYESERFLFNESRSVTFSTVAGQEFYDKSDAAGLGTIQKIDYVVLYIGNTPYHLKAMAPSDIETASVSGTNTGQPGWYCWYGSQIRLYPCPADVWAVRIGAFVKVAAPASDTEADNPWMTTAERLIRSRAKLELALHVLKDPEMAQTMNLAVTEAFDQVKARTNKLTQIGDGRIAAMEF